MHYLTIYCSLGGKLISRSFPAATRLHQVEEAPDLGNQNIGRDESSAENS